MEEKIAAVIVGPKMNRKIHEVMRDERGLVHFKVEYDEFFRLELRHMLVLLESIRKESEELWQQTVKEKKKESMDMMQSLVGSGWRTDRGDS